MRCQPVFDNKPLAEGARRLWLHYRKSFEARGMSRRAARMKASIAVNNWLGAMRLSEVKRWAQKHQ